jgi:hypothetical protein
MLTRSGAKDCMARAVFEQPPVLDVILRNIQYENENENKNENENDTVLTQRDMVSLLLVFKTPAVVDVIEACRRRLMQQRFRKRMFVVQIHKLLVESNNLPGSADIDYKRAHIFRFMDALAENKELMCGTLFFANMSNYIENYIEFVNNNYPHNPVFRTRVAAY